MQKMPSAVEKEQRIKTDLFTILLRNFYFKVLFEKMVELYVFF